VRFDLGPALARRAAWPAAAVLALLIAQVSAARADCTPAAASNITANCTGATTNQGGGAPGSSAGGDGYGSGGQTGITVIVAGGAGNSVAGTNSGIRISDGTVTNNAGASITGGSTGIRAPTGLTLNNFGAITGTSSFGISAGGATSVTNNAGASITGGDNGIVAGNLVISNSGSVVGVTGNGIISTGAVTLTNTDTGSITGGSTGIAAGTSITVTNSGLISGTADVGLIGTTVTVTNSASGSIIGGLVGVAASVGSANVNNYGLISSGNTGISGNTSVIVTNNAGGRISSVNTAIAAGAGGSSVFNAGSIISTGGAAISFTGAGNTLTLAAGSAITGNVLGGGTDTFQLGGSSAATFDASQLGPAAQYRGFGTFNKIDSSIWTLTGTSTFAGDINVNGGTLVVNGNVSAAGIMMVNPGGTLSGTGVVPFTLLDDGATLAPGPVGSGTGALTIMDRVMFCACSLYSVKVSGTGNDFAQIMAGGGLGGTGDAFLDGPVRVSSPTSSYRFNTPYTILTTQGGLNGTTFSSLTTPVGIVGALSYTADDVLLTLTSQLSQTPGLNANQRAVANVLDTAFNASGNSGALGAVFAGDVPRNLTQASGETGTGAQQTTFSAMTQFMGLLTDPFLSGRGNGPAPAGASPFAAEGEASAYAAAGRKRTGSEREAYGMIAKAAPSAALYDPRWSVWAAGFGGSQATDGNAALGSNGATSRLAGAAVGADYWVSPFTIAGFSLAGGGTNFSVANGGSGRSDLFQAGAFVRHNVGAAYITAAAAYGWQDIITDRTVTIAGLDRLRAEFNANAYSGRVEGGYRFVAPWIGGVGITPYAAAQATTFDLPAYAEGAVLGSNAFALSYAAKSATDTRSELGLRTDKAFALTNAVLTLRGRAAWAHDFNPDRALGATFQTLPGASFVVNGAAQARDAALVTASAEMKWLNGWSAAASFEGEFSDVTRSYAGKGAVRYAW
jgi:uncharacterized protein with beta-barrel porin domain